MQIDFIKHRKKKSWKEKLIYGGISKKEYEQITELILGKNTETLQFITFMLGFIFCGLAVGSFCFKELAPGRKVYWMVFGLIVVLHIMSLTIFAERKKWTLPVWYLLISIICCYAVALNTIIRPGLSATTFCVLLIAAPLLVMDQPYRLICFLVGVWLVFECIAWNTKSYYLAFADTCNTFCCLFLGIAIYMHIIQVKHREMVQRQHLKKQRDTDKLTGLFNKASMEYQIRKILKQERVKGAFLIMDVDNFKEINDRYGHAFGDTVLRLIGEQISDCFGTENLCGRFGGDEFFILMQNVQREQVVSRLNQLYSLAVEKIPFPDENKKIGLSIGIFLMQGEKYNYQQLFEQADAALYHAKNQGKNRYVFYRDVIR